MLKVADIMSPEVFTISEDDTLDHASFLLNTELMSGAPVSNRSGEITGMISEADVTAPEQGTAATTKVSDVMQGEVLSIDPEEPARAAAQRMLDKGVHRLLVRSEGGEPQGIVTATDIVRAVAMGVDFD